MSTDMNKKHAYRKLVQERRACRLCEGLVNPATYEYDSDEIGSWSMWQGNLDADLIVVAQDWGDTDTFEKLKGIDPPTGYRTNNNLKALLHHIGIEIGRPGDDQENTLFFTNIILCLKSGNIQTPVEIQWANTCGEKFFQPLVDLIQPRVILALGEHASKAILHLYDVPFNKYQPLKAIMEKSPYSLNASTVLFPLYHCGAQGVNRNRPFETQEQDWARVGDWIKQQGLS